MRVQLLPGLRKKLYKMLPHHVIITIIILITMYGSLVTLHWFTVCKLLASYTFFKETFYNGCVGCVACGSSTKAFFMVIFCKLSKMKDTDFLFIHQLRQSKISLWMWGVCRLLFDCCCSFVIL